jgi:Outer membrane protein beta-barrel domain
MRKIIWLIIMLIPIAVYSQQPDKNKESKKSKSKISTGIGIKAGLNFANVTNASSINSKSQTGFHAGLFFGGSSKSLIGFRTELIYSRQGYGFLSGSTAGSVKLNYIMLAQLMAINITRFVQIQIGGQMAYLVNAKTDSTKQSTGNAGADKIINFYNRLDYGFGAGVEIHPVAGLLIGARYNISLANLYKQSSSADASSNTSGSTSFLPAGSGINFKNNVVQIFIGYRF